MACRQKHPARSTGSNYLFVLSTRASSSQPLLAFSFRAGARKMSPVWNCAPSGCPTCRIAVMPRVVPSQIVEAIDKLSLHQYQALGFEESVKPAAILSLID